MSYALTGNIKHSNGLYKRGYKRKGELDNIKRRKVIGGYPKNFIFESKEKIDEYFNGDKIICLMCGHSFKTLVTHLNHIHGMSTEVYKQKYGLPLSSGLAGLNTKYKYSINMKKRIEDGIIDMSPETQDIRIKAMQSVTKTTSVYKKLSSMENINKALNKDGLELDFRLKKVWSKEDYHKVIDLSVKLGVAPIDLMQSGKYKIPKRSAFHKQFQVDPELREKYYQCMDKLPIEIQTKHRMIGPVIKQRIKEMRAEGFTQPQMSEVLKISIGSIINIIAELDLPKFKKTHCHKGHPYVGNNRKCEICPLEIRRKKGILPKKDAGKTIVEKNCFQCKEPIKASKMGKAFCNECKIKNYYESQKKYNDSNRERRREMATVARIKRKERKAA